MTTTLVKYLLRIKADEFQFKSLESTIIPNNVLRWTVEDIKNVNLILGNNIKKIPNISFDSAENWFEIFIPYVIDELRSDLENSILKGFPIANKCDHAIDSSDRISVQPTSIRRSYGDRNQSFDLITDKTEHDFESLSYGTISVFVKYPTIPDSTILSQCDHFFCYISKPKENSDHEIFIDAFESNASKQLLSDGGNEWKLLFLDFPLITSQRTLQALARRREPPFFNDIISCNQVCNEYLQFGVTSRSPVINEHFSEITTKCNESQKEAIFASIFSRGYPAIKVIHGPPGTGKTSTLVSLLRLYLCSPNLVIHATAPTNIAVCELARRFTNRFVNNNLEEYNVNPTDIIIVGDRKKLVLEGGLERFSLDFRLERLNENKEKIEKICNILFQLKNTDFVKDIYKTKQEIQPDMSFHNFINEYLENISQTLYSSATTLLEEHPKCLFSIDHIYNAMNAFKTLLSLSHSIISSWLVNDPCHESIRHNLQNIINEVYYLKRINMTNLRKEVIKRARLIFSTVMAGGRDMFDDIPVDIVVIDEATQLVEAQTCVLFRESLQCLVLAGDNKQLPATTMSTHPLAEGYKRSLFDRLIDNNYPSYLLNIQYRMHPDISRWPRIQFYDGKIRDGDNVMSTDYCKPWHNTIPPFSLYDISSGIEETDVMGSKFNRKEELVVRRLLNHIHKTVGNTTISIGIISPYKAQVERLSPLSTIKECSIIVKTVDGFQGQECDIIIFTAVKSNTAKKIGFLSDTRRLNVALTRAKYALIVLCNVQTLESNRTWKDMIESAKTREQYINESNSTIIHSVNKKKIDEMLSESSSIFENSLWKIQFNNDFFVSIRKQDQSVKSIIFTRILQLSNGKLHTSRNRDITTNKDTSKDRDSDRDIYNMLLLQVLKINNLNLLWSIDIRKLGGPIQSSTVCYEQEIKIWNLVSDNHVDYSRRRILKGMESYSEDRIKMCIEISMSNGTEIYQPMRFMRSCDMKLIINTNENINDKIESSEIENASTLMKFYSLSSSFARRLISSNESIKLDLPFTMSSEEESIVSYPGSLFILGRSGTGKTTVMLRRMYTENQYSLNLCHHTDIGDSYTTTSTTTADEMRHCRQMLVTASPILCEAIRKSYKALCDSSSVSPVETETKHGNDNNNSEMQSKVMRAIGVTTSTSTTDDNTSLLQCNQDSFPLILTYRNFLIRLDKCLYQPFFINSFKIPWDDVVDFDIFLADYYSRFNNTLTNQLDCELMFTEVMTNIKGSITALHSTNGHISENEYLQISGSRESFLGREIRTLIYDSFLKYERLKGESRQYDMADVVNYIYRQCRERKFKGTTDSLSSLLTNIYVDEVQDLSPAQLSLFQFVCNNYKGYMFAGDTAQTIAHGVGFRFEAIKDVFYKEFLQNGGRNNTTTTTNKSTHTHTVPILKQLVQNFRTNSGVVNLARSVVELIVRLFPNSIDKMEPEWTSVHGRPPIFITTTYDVVTELFQNGEMHSCEFGAEQAILVRDEVTKRHVQGISGRNALILTAQEAKGMEFTDCLVYNFFTSSRYKDDWRVLYSTFESSNNNNNSTKARSFDRFKHSELCVELKTLYVLLTRAKQRLIIFDGDVDSRAPMLSFWNSQGLVTESPFDEDIRTIFSSNTSTPEEWKQRGDEFFHRLQFGNAGLCYQRADYDYGCRWAEAEEIRQEANNDHTNFNQAKIKLLRAAKIFISLGDKSIEVARCFEKAKEDEKAAQYYTEANDFHHAAQCYERILQWQEAAKYYRKCNEINSAIKCYFKILDYDSALNMLDEAISNENVSASDKRSFILTRHDCVRKGALHYHSIKHMEKILQFISYFDAIEKITFLSRYKYHNELLRIELDSGNFKEVADIYADKSDYLNAAVHYEKCTSINNDKVIWCLLRYIRLKYVDIGFLTTPIAKEDELCVLKIVKLSSNHPNKSLIRLEIDILHKGPNLDLPENMKLLRRTHALGEDALPLTISCIFLCIRKRNQSSDSTEEIEFVLLFQKLLETIVLPVLDKIGSGYDGTSRDRIVFHQCLEWFMMRVDTSLGAINSILLENIPAIKKYFGNKRSLSPREVAQRAAQYFRNVICEARWHICHHEVKEPNKMVLMSFGVFTERLTKRIEKRVDIHYETRNRLQRQLDLYEVLRDSVVLDKGTTTKDHNQINTRTSCIWGIYKIVLPSMIHLEDVDDVVQSRQCDRTRECIKDYMTRGLSQPGLKYESIGLSLLLGEIIGETSSIAHKLIRICNTEFNRRNATQEEKDWDLRYYLIRAFEWEQVPNDCASAGVVGSFMYSVELGVNAVVYEAYYGILAHIIWRDSQPRLSRLCDGSYSPEVFMCLVEKYAVLTLLVAKDYSNVLLPLSLVKDVLCRRNVAYATDIRSCQLNTMPPNMKSERKKIANKQKLELLKLLLAILKQFNDIGINRWVKAHHATGDVICSIQILVFRLFRLATTISMDMPDRNRNAHYKTLENLVPLFISKYKLLSHFKLIKPSATLTAMRTFFDELEDTLVVLYIDPAAPVQRRYQKITLLITTVDDKGNSSDTIRLQSKTHGILTENQAEEVVADDEGPAGHGSKSDIAPYTAPPPPQRKRVTIKLRSLLMQTRRRLEGLFPLDKERREAEKEFLLKGMSRTCTVALDYFNKIFPIYFNIKEARNKCIVLIEELKNETTKLDKYDQLMDGVMPLEQALSDYSAANIMSLIDVETNTSISIRHSFEIEATLQSFLQKQGLQALLLNRPSEASHNDGLRSVKARIRSHVLLVSNRDYCDRSAYWSPEMQK
eukprot:gene1018-1996_t